MSDTEESESTLLPAAEDGAAPPMARARWSWRRRLALLVVCVGAVVAVGAVGVGIVVSSLGATYDSLRKTLPDDQVFPSSSADPSAPASTGGGAAQNVLLLGTDTRGAAPTSLAAIRAQRSDTMLLVHIPTDGQHVYVMSIMRDSWVNVPGHGMAKINAALSYGGVPMTVQVVQNLYGIHIDHVAIVSFGGFEGLTDALGGVTVNNTIAFSEWGYTYPKGQITLEGERALTFVRTRYVFPDGDYQRVRDQQAYFAGVLEKVLTPGTLLDPLRLHNAVAAISPYVLTDRGLDSAYIARMALQLRSLHSSDVVYFTSPTDGTGMVGDQSVVFIDQSGVDEIGQDIRNDDLGAYQPCRVTVCP